MVRERALQNGLKTAVKVPMTLARKASALFTPLEQLAKLGNINCKSDLQVIQSSNFSLSFFYEPTYSHFGHLGAFLKVLNFDLRFLLDAWLQPFMEECTMSKSI